MTRSLLILGAGGHALSVADAAESAGFHVVGFVSDHGANSPSLAAPIFPDVSSAEWGTLELALGIGANFIREEIYASTLENYPELVMASVIHASAWVSHTAVVHAGAVVLSQASVGPGANLGIGSLINTAASLDHESQMGDFASLGPGAHTGGRVTIGARSMVGLNAGVLQGRKIGDDTVIGAHSLATQDFESNVVVLGIPCQVVKNREREDPYF